MDLSAATPQDEDLEKDGLRSRMRERRGRVSLDESRAAGAAAALLLEPLLDPLARLARPAATVYAALPGEVDTAAIDSLLRARGLRVAYPRVAPDGRLRLHLVAPAELEPGTFGIREPRGDAPELAPSELHLAVVPGLAFDRQGGRLGFGRGYYDRLLEAAPDALRLGVCFSHQILPRVPVTPRDAPMDFILGDDLIPTGARPRFRKEHTP